jgi:hypothetical protein
MPETAMHEYDSLMFGKNNVGLSCKSFVMQFEAVSFSVQPSPHSHFGLGIDTPDFRHDFTAFSLADLVHFI